MKTSFLKHLAVGLAFFAFGQLSAQSEKPQEKSLSVSIIQDNNNGSLEKSTETIKINSKAELHKYLENKGVNMKDMTVFKSRKAHPHPHVWILNRSRHQIGEPQVMVIDVNEKENVKTEDNGNETVVKTVVINKEDSESTEKKSHEIKIEKKVDKDGNVQVKKWIDGKEVDPSTPTPGTRVFVQKHQLDAKGKKQCSSHKGNNAEYRYEMIQSNSKAYDRPIDFMAKNADGSTIVIVKSMEKTSNQKISAADESLRFFPNPASNNFTLSLESNAEENIEIHMYSMEGKEVFNSSDSSTGMAFKKEIDTSDLESGVYSIVVKQGSTSISKKLVIK
jgi:hypothetical protein